VGKNKQPLLEPVCGAILLAPQINWKQFLIGFRRGAPPGTRCPPHRSLPPAHPWPPDHPITWAPARL